MLSGASKSLVVPRICWRQWQNPPRMSLGRDFFRLLEGAEGESWYRLSDVSDVRESSDGNSAMPTRVDLGHGMPQPSASSFTWRWMYYTPSPRPPLPVGLLCVVFILWSYWWFAHFHRFHMAATGAAELSPYPKLTPPAWLWHFGNLMDKSAGCRHYVHSCKVLYASGTIWPRQQGYFCVNMSWVQAF